jgi:hypothetical protein
MEEHPLSHQQAKALSGKYQDIIGQTFVNNEGMIASIKYVTISPFDHLNKYIFLLDYAACKNLDQALRNYQGRVFNVIVLGNTDSGTTIHKSLFQHLADSNIGYDLDWLLQ